MWKQNANKMQQRFLLQILACSTYFGHHYAHHQELKSIIQWLLRVVFRAVVFKLLVWCGAEGYVSGLQDGNAFHPAPGSKRSSILHKMYQCRCTAKNS